MASPSLKDTTKITCLGCNKKFVAILQHLVRAVSCRDHYDYEALVKERNKRSEENRAKNRKRYSETLRQKGLPQNEAVLEQCQGCGKKFVSLLKHLSTARNCPQAYGGQDKVAAMARERRMLRGQAYDRKKYLKKRETMCEKQRQYHHEHKDQIRAVKQRYRSINREKNRERARGYHKKIKDMKPEERERRRKRALERYHREKALAKGDCSSASQSRKKLSPADQDASINCNVLDGNPRLKTKEPPDRSDEVKNRARNACNGLTVEPTDLRSTEHQIFSKEIFPKINERRQEPPAIKEDDTDGEVSSSAEIEVKPDDASDNNEHAEDFFRAQDKSVHKRLSKSTIKKDDDDGEVSSIAEIKIEPDNASDNNELAKNFVRAQDNSVHKRVTKSTKSRKKNTKKSITKQKDIARGTSKDANHLDNSSVPMTTVADKPDGGRIALKRSADVSQSSDKSAQGASARDAHSYSDSAFGTEVWNTSRYNKLERVVPPAGKGEPFNKNVTNDGTSIRKGNTHRNKRTAMISCILKQSTDFSEEELHEPADAHRAECDGVPTRRLASNSATASELCVFEHWREAVSLPPKCVSGQKRRLKRTLESSDPSQFKTIKKRKR